MRGQLVEQAPAAVEPLDAEAAGSERLVLAEVGLARVLLDLPGVVLRAEEPGVLARPDSGPSIRKVGSITPLGMPSARGRIVVEGRGVAGIVVARGDLVEERARLRSGR